MSRAAVFRNVTNPGRIQAPVEMVESLAHGWFG
jgi:hypothetical protein